MKNKNVCEIFVEGDRQVKTKNVFMEGRVIYSYGHHFPMALKLNDDVFILNPSKYSSSTSRQQSALKSAVSYKKYFYCKDTAELKEFIYNNFTDIAQIPEHLKQITINRLKDDVEK